MSGIEVTMSKADRILDQIRELQVQYRELTGESTPDVRWLTELEARVRKMEKMMPQYSEETVFRRAMRDVVDKEELQRYINSKIDGVAETFVRDFTKLAQNKMKIVYGESKCRFILESVTRDLLAAAVRKATIDIKLNLDPKENSNE
jgi:hypothetical protein